MHFVDESGNQAPIHRIDGADHIEHRHQSAAAGRKDRHQRLTVIFNLVIALLTAALVISLVRIRRRHRRIAQRGIPTRSALWSRIAIALAVNLTLPVVLLIVWLAVPAWPNGRNLADVLFSGPTWN